MDDVLSLAGRVALVTGAGSGIGAATARALAQAGAQVALLDRDGATVTRTASQIGVTGSDALPFTVDVTDAFALERVVDHVCQEWERIDVLVNAAEIAHEASLAELTDDDWHKVVDVNLRGALVCARAVSPAMVAARSGRILTLVSSAARTGQFGHTALAATHGGLVAMTRTWARELGPHGVLANAVAPGLVAGDHLTPEQAEELQRRAASLPARRPGRPDEVASVFVFLASDLASFVNGAVVGVDGGLLL